MYNHKHNKKIKLILMKHSSDKNLKLSEIRLKSRNELYKIRELYSNIKCYKNDEVLTQFFMDF